MNENFELNERTTLEASLEAMDSMRVYLEKMRVWIEETKNEENPMISVELIKEVFPRDTAIRSLENLSSLAGSAQLALHHIFTAYPQLLEDLNARLQQSADTELVSAALADPTLSRDVS